MARREIAWNQIRFECRETPQPAGYPRSFRFLSIGRWGKAGKVRNERLLIPAKTTITLYRYAAGMTLGSGSYLSYLHSDPVGSLVGVYGYSERGTVFVDLPRGGCGGLPISAVTALEWPQELAHLADALASIADEPQEDNTLLIPPSAGYGSLPTGYVKVNLAGGCVMPLDKAERLGLLALTTHTPRSQR